MIYDTIDENLNEFIWLYHEGSVPSVIQIWVVSWFLEIYLKQASYP